MDTQKDKSSTFNALTLEQAQKQVDRVVNSNIMFKMLIPKNPLAQKVITLIPKFLVCLSNDIDCNKDLQDLGLLEE